MTSFVRHRACRGVQILARLRVWGDFPLHHDKLELFLLQNRSIKVDSGHEFLLVLFHLPLLPSSSEAGVKHHNNLVILVNNTACNNFLVLLLLRIHQLLNLSELRLPRNRVLQRLENPCLILHFHLLQCLLLFNQLHDPLGLFVGLRFRVSEPIRKFLLKQIKFRNAPFWAQ